MTRRSLPPILAVLVPLTVACGGSSAASRAAEPAAARTVAVVRLASQPLERTITVTGTLAAEEQVTLSLKVTGRLEQLLVDLGSPVRKGQVLARLTPTDFELRLRQSVAALQQARARLGLDPTGDDDTIDITRTSLVRQAQAALSEAQRQRQRVATFVDRGISARADLETAEAQLEIADGRLEDAMEEVRNRQAVLAQRRSEVALAQQQLDDTVLRAPIDGVVRERMAFAGEYRSAGTPILTVVRQHPLRLQLAVPERSAAGLKVGQLVRVTVEGDATVHEGRVARLSPSIAEGTRTLPIEATIPNPEGQLRPGTFATAAIVTSEGTGLLIPLDALVVFAGVEKVLLARDGKAHEQRVRTGLRLGDRVELVDGVAAGDLVILAPGGLAAGSPIVVQ